MTSWIGAAWSSPVEASRHVPGRRDALERLHHGLAHVALDARIGHAERKGYVPAKPAFIPEVVGVTGKEFTHDLRVGLLALGVPHLLVASHGEHACGLVDLTLALQDSGIVGKGRRRGVVRVLSAHHLRD